MNALLMWWNMVREWDIAELLSRTLVWELCLIAILLLLSRQWDLEMVFSAETSSVAFGVSCVTALTLLRARGWLFAAATGTRTVGRLTTAALFVSGTGLATNVTS